MADLKKNEALDLTALKAQLKAELKAELEAEQTVAREAEVTAAPAVADPSLEDYVYVQLFKDGKDYKDDLYVSINGDNCLIKRGIPVRVKRKFALLIEQSMRQDISAQEYAEQQQQEFTHQIHVYNV